MSRVGAAELETRKKRQTLINTNRKSGADGREIGGGDEACNRWEATVVLWWRRTVGVKMCGAVVLGGRERWALKADGRFYDLLDSTFGDLVPGLCPGG